MKAIKLTDISEDLLSLIEPATKGGASIFMQYDGKGIDQVTKAHIMHDIYRLYIVTDNGFGEHRYDADQAKHIYLVI